MATDWAKLKVVQLKAELKRRGLSQIGLKGELVERLDAADNEESQPQQEEEEEDVEDVEVEEAQAEEQDERQEDVTAPLPVEAETGSVEDAPAEQIEKRSEPVASGKDEPVQEEASAGLTDERAPTTKDRIATPVAAEAQPDDGDDGGAQMPIGVASKRERSTTPDKQVQERVSSSVPPESTSSTQKRKQRSASPTPKEEEGSSKRVRTEETTNGEPLRVDTRPAEDKAVAVASTMDATLTEADVAERMVEDDNERSGGAEPTSNTVDMDYERDAPPAIHPATRALYISKLKRPVHSEEMEEHLIRLASPNSHELADDIIVRLYIDQIRTHAFAVLRTTSAASRVRAALHDKVWPDESTREALSVDFVPPEKVNEWIEMEESNGNGRSGTRWEVVYRDGPDGTVEATLESASTSASKSAAPSSSNNNSNNNNTAPPTLGGDSANTIPVGPRRDREMNPPTGPRAVRPGTGPGPRPPPSALGNAVERTRARPTIPFQLVDKDIAQRRIDNMRSFYTRDKNRDFGREINRYSFEDGDSFVDRGKEVFEGIRPPHRERAVERERRGGGGGGGRGGGYGGRPPRRGPPPFRPRSDRYLPSRDGGSYHNGDDRRFRYDDDRSSRYGGDWDRDFRSSRR